MQNFPHTLFGMRDFDIKTEVKLKLISGIMMASDDEEDFLDRVYLHLTEKRYAYGTSENCKRMIRKKALKFVITLNILTS